MQEDDLSERELALKEVLSAVAQHRYAKTDEAAKIWYDKIRGCLKEYYDAIAKEHAK